MLTVSRVLDASLLVSVFWGMIAIGSLLIALVLRDKILGQSSLLIFALSGMKVLVYDLAGSPAPVRIGTLVVLGVTLYIGGWLYQKLSVGEDPQGGVPLSSASSG
jgi:fucose permease